jgi:protein phosphatase
VIAGKPGIPDAFVIADGMGGHKSGEIASKIAVEHISNAIESSIGLFSGDKDAADYLKMLLEETNRVVYEKSLEYTGNNGMGTTLTVAVIIGKTMYIGHIGDSRLYLIRNGAINRVTTDHSYIEELVKNGTITRQEADRHPDRNIITRALGCSNKLEVDIYTLEIEPSDSFLLCTDGLTNMLTEDEIMSIVCNNAPEAACEELVKRANQNGGEDNITVIVIKNE